MIVDTRTVRIPYSARCSGALRFAASRLQPPCGRPRMLGIFRCRLEHRQFQRLEQIVLERLRPGVGTDLNAAGHCLNLLPQFQQPDGALALLADHGGFVHEQAVILHQAAVNRRG